jgi:adenylate cyclase
VAGRLLEAGAAAVAINVVFEGPSAAGAEDDAAMADLLRRHRGRIALAAEMLEGSYSEGFGSLSLVRPEVYLPALGTPPALGLTNILPRVPGSHPSHPEAYGGGLLPAQGIDPFPSLSTTLLRLGGRSSRQDDVKAALNAYGSRGSFRRLSAWEVLDPDRWRAHPLRASLAGSLVLLGPVITQGDDGYPTPFGPLPALEVLATATANSLEGSGLMPWPAVPWRRALLAALPVLLVCLAARRLKGLAARLALVGGVLVVVLTAAAVGLRQSHRWLPLLSPGSGLVLLALVYGGDAYYREERERRRLRRTFERYVAPGVVAEILAHPDTAQGVLRGRLLEVTVLMADLRDFTALTRRRSDAGQSELHVRQLNAYLAEMVEVISEHGGTVDKFIGDAVMAVFGSPVSRGVEEEARAALRCAIAMRRALAELNREWQRQGIETLENSLGLGSGEVMVGQIGSPRRMEFTVIGDIVNLAARMESLTRVLGEPVLLDGRTAELVAAAGDLPVRSLGQQEVKGIGPVEVFAAASATVHSCR